MNDTEVYDAFKKRIDCLIEKAMTGRDTRIIEFAIFSILVTIAEILLFQFHPDRWNRQ